MISVSCKFRKKITELHAEAQEVMAEEEKVEEKYAPLMAKLTEWTAFTAYKPTKSCEIDVMFAEAINKAKLDLTFKRTDKGKYVFGTKTILAKVVNGRLLIRVGGGYMGVQDFINTHGPLEMEKMNKKSD
jgi:hypothetical protein